VSAAWPDRQGAQVLTHQIRGLDHRRSLRVIALSDSPDGAGETADDAITRPIDRCEAIARVRVMVQRSRLFGLCRGTDGGAFRWGAGRAVFPDRRPPPERYAA
jgi:DNA-binding response OmpR family regulator